MCKGILNESISQYAFFGRLLLTCLTKPLIKLIVWNTLIHTKGIDGNPFGYTLRLVEKL